MSAQDTKFYKKMERIFNRNAPAMVMGILNITPDSFYDGGKYTDEKRMLLKAKTMIDEGADIIDIGAQSTRPGAIDVSEQEETKRLMNAIRMIRLNFPEILISADTFRANIAEKAIVAGANMINDISGGTMDKQMFTTIKELNVPYVLTHIQGTPQTMQKNPIYKNITQEIITFFKEQLEQLNGLGTSKIIIDPGFGFGKTLAHNYILLNELQAFDTLHTPVLIGVSRKSMIWKALHLSAEEALNGTTILNTVALLKGAKILRVHDVKEAKEAVMLVGKLRN